MPARSVLRRKPLQAAKFLGVLLALTLSVLGFLRIVGGPGLLLDGQFLALVLTPLVALALVALVCCETLYSAYRIARADASLREQAAGRLGYALVRGVEAAVAVCGALLIVSLYPVLTAESTPAPAGVGIMLLALAVGVFVLLASLVRSGAELLYWT